MLASIALVLFLTAQTPAATYPVDNAPQTAGSVPAPDTASSAPEPDENGVYHKLLGVPGMVPPKITREVDPKFADEVSGMKFTGKTVVGLIVDVKGTPTNVHVVRSIADDVQSLEEKKRVIALDERAIEAVRRYRFKPATLNGKPVPVQLSVKVDFRIY